MRNQNPVQVTAAIIRRPGQVLLARRRRGSHLEGYWEFPGGKIETGETAKECLGRELQEEFGLGSTIGDFITSSRFAYSEGEIELLAYEVELAVGEWVLESHDEARFVELRDLPTYKLAPADIPIAELLVRDS